MTTFADKPTLDALTGSLTLALPELALAGCGCLLFAHGMLLRVRGLNWTIAFFGLLTAIGLAIGANWIEEGVHESLRNVAPILPGPFASFIRWLVLGVGLILLFLSTKEASYEIAGEYYGCLFIALAGGSLLGRANDLVTLFVALEMISIPTYVMLYLPHRGPAGQEAAAKYFLLSILSSAVLLFGLSYLYGLAGTTNLWALVETLTAAHRASASPMAVLAMVLVVAGLGFRITAVPFHYYAPDVYQGGPTAAIAQLAVLPKIAGFAVLAKLLGITVSITETPFPNGTQVPLMLWVIAAVTMTLGNLMALVQDNLKRLLAYSGIAHAGYLLLGFVAATAYAPTESAPAHLAGLDSVLVYLVAYALMTLGTFAVIIYVGYAETVDDLAGLGRTHPVAALCLAVSLLSLIGLPLTAGFTGKLLLFFGLIDAPTNSGLGVMYRVLAVIAAVNAAIGAVYYLRILGVVYLRAPLNPDARAAGHGPLVAAFLCAVGTIAVGVYPKPLVEAARLAAPVVNR
jgi:NADH-quinone oxidoreductase subunit N